MHTYYFEWTVQGYNTVKANTKREALKLARALGRECRTPLVPNPKTCRRVTSTELQGLERGWASLFY